MVFSSKIFLHVFLPCVLAVYYLILRKRSDRNAFLALASLFFYAWGEKGYVLLMLISIGLNGYAGRRIERALTPRSAKAWMIATVTVDVAMLGVFKYLGFLVSNINACFSLALPVPHLHMPIGISFYTFQAISYVVDVYRKELRAQPKLMNVCLYIALFPQLIAGPIVRYSSIAEEIEHRTETLSDFTEGLMRFLVGMGKKLIIANRLAVLTDEIFAMGSGNLTVVTAWFGAIAYFIQLYFDFSGYSDMALGLGAMFGFHFPENFRYPLLACSFTDFWRRWHISLGTWFKDYVYFPLGGSRSKTWLRRLFNTFVVWMLTCMWHGANWTFAVWGVYCTVIITIERQTGFGRRTHTGVGGHVYTLILVILAAVLMRAESMACAMGLYRAMLFPSGIPLYNAMDGIYLREYGGFLLIGLLAAFPFVKPLCRKLHIPDSVYELGRGVGMLIIGVLSLALLFSGSYNPFIYFNF